MTQFSEFLVFPVFDGLVVCKEAGACRMRPADIFVSRSGLGASIERRSLR